jgi:hypothetical protein
LGETIEHKKSFKQSLLPLLVPAFTVAFFGGGNQQAQLSKVVTVWG